MSTIKLNVENNIRFDGHTSVIFTCLSFQWAWSRDWWRHAALSKL